MTFMRFTINHYTYFKIYTVCIIFDNYINNPKIKGISKKGKK